MAEEMVYVYKLLDNRVEEYTGKFIRPGMGYYSSVEINIESGNVKKVHVHPKEGVIFANTIWFKEANVCKAIDIFVDILNEELEELLLKSHVIIDNVTDLLIQKNKESDYSQ